VKLCQTFVAEAVADMSEEEAPMRLGVEESLILSDQEVEVAVDITAVTEPQVQCELRGIVGNRSKHCRFER
jgi:hypothetical protein